MGISIILNAVAIAQGRGNCITWSVIDSQGAVQSTGESLTFSAGAADALAAFKKYLASQVENFQNLSGSV